jgi:hypothetical protein
VCTCEILQILQIYTLFRIPLWDTSSWRLLSVRGSPSVSSCMPRRLQRRSNEITAVVHRAALDHPRGRMGSEHLEPTSTLESWSWVPTPTLESRNQFHLAIRNWILTWNWIPKWNWPGAGLELLFDIAGHKAGAPQVWTLNLKSTQEAVESNRMQLA